MDNTFSLGQTKADDSKKKTKTEDKRMQAYNMGVGSKDDLKKERENFAVNLRKNKKQEMFQAKRAMQAKQEITQASASGNKSNEKELKRIELSEALAQQKQMADEDYIKLVQSMEFKLEDFSQLVELVLSQENEKLFLGVTGFRRILSLRNPPIQAVIDANLIQKFLSFLQRTDFTKLQFEATWCITNIASGSSDNCQALIDKGTINLLVQLLNSNDPEVVEQAIWGLGNIAGDNTNFRNLVIDAGAVNPIANILDRSDPGSTLTRNASWSLSNLCRNHPCPDYNLVRRAVPSLARVLLNEANSETVLDICWAFSYLSDGGEERIPDILSTNIQGKLMELLKNPKVGIVIPSMRTIGNLVTGTDETTQTLIDMGLIRLLDELSTHQSKMVRKEVCWTISNITAGTPEQIGQVYESGLFNKVCFMLKHDDIEIKKEAVWAVSNCTTCDNVKLIEMLVKQGMIEALVSVLKLQGVKMIAVALEGIDTLLKIGQDNFTFEGENQFATMLENVGGIDAIEALQQHPNEYIYEQAYNVLEKYFQDEDDFSLPSNATAGAQAADGKFNF